MAKKYSKFQGILADHLPVVTNNQAPFLQGQATLFHNRDGLRLRRLLFRFERSILHQVPSSRHAQQPASSNDPGFKSAERSPRLAARNRRHGVRLHNGVCGCELRPSPNSQNEGVRTDPSTLSVFSVPGLHTSLSL